MKSSSTIMSSSWYFVSSRRKKPKVIQKPKRRWLVLTSQYEVDNTYIHTCTCTWCHVVWMWEVGWIQWNCRWWWAGAVIMSCRIQWSRSFGASIQSQARTWLRKSHALSFCRLPDARSPRQRQFSHTLHKCFGTEAWMNCPHKLQRLWSFSELMAGQWLRFVQRCLLFNEVHQQRPALSSCQFALTTVSLKPRQFACQRQCLTQK